MPKEDILQTILEESDYRLSLFSKEEIKSLRKKVFLKTTRRKETPFVKCIVRDKDIQLKPEEIVRQLYLERLINQYGYSKNQIEIEKAVYFGSTVRDKRADIVIMDKNDPTAAYIIIEVKKPNRRDGLEQLKSYCHAEGSPIGVWTNGSEIIYLHREDPNYFRHLTDIPTATQKLSDLFKEHWDYERLTKENKLVKERLSLKDIILDMEDLVLANAGVDAFEEVFKLIYSKLFDEWQAARGSKKKKYLLFRVEGATPKEFYEKIDSLFQKAKKQWPGVFLSDEKIKLTPRHLITCGSFLEDIKLFNSNLQIIDEAFEYLSIQVGKGSKGQYFTPRHVIDMCVKMINPKIDEYMIDTAAGSCGFTVHTIFHVWGNQFNAEGPIKWQSDYASQFVYGIDFDDRAIKIAKALNLIAGDGRTNIYLANTLDPRDWDENVRVGLKDRIRKDEKRSRESYRYFDFDVLMTNPPFAGDIKDSRIIHQYELGQKWKKVAIDPEKEPEEAKNYAGSGLAEELRPSGRWSERIGRDVLFIERNLEFIKPGGRLCIVLPQGRLNNTSDEYIRKFISQRARILAVVGLHVNTFKPHTPTKTSVMFLQKWNNDESLGPLCPYQDDYPIFFATSQKGGKTNSGDPDYKKNKKGLELLDGEGHMILNHDLDEIAEGFKKFSKREGLSFWAEEE